MSRWNDPNLPAWVTDRGVTRGRIRELKRLEAEERNAAWAALSYVEKIERLHRRRGMTLKQRTRLTTTQKKRALERRAAGGGAA